MIRDTRIGWWATIAFLGLIAFIGLLVFGQAASPDLSPVEKIAFEAIQVEFNKANADLRVLMVEISQSHPGYHFNPNTGGLDKDAPPAKGDQPKTMNK